MNARPPLEVVRETARRVLAERDFLTFLSGVQVRRDGPLEDGSPLVAFELWPHVRERAEAWAEKRSEVILKARQLGISTLAQAYALHVAMRGGAVLVISKGDDASKEFLEKLADIEANLPADWRIAVKTANTDTLSFENGGRINVKAPTIHAGRSQANTLVIIDEAAMHPYAAENYTAYRPTVSAGGQLLIISTAHGDAGFFRDMYWRSVEGKTPYGAVFIPWHARPGRDAAWLANERLAFPDTEAAFQQEYPSTAIDAFRAHSGLVYGMDADGVRIFDPSLNLRPAKVPWSECRWRIAGVDPGGQDPSGLVGVGVDRNDHLHLYGARRHQGAFGVEHASEYLGQWEKHGHIDAVVCDPSQGTLVESLRAMGWPAMAAVNDKAPGIGFVSSLLKSRRLTIDPDIPEVVEELNGYFWAERRANTVGGSNALRTTCGPGHHADLLDALRYAVVEAVRGAWRMKERDDVPRYDNGVRRGMARGMRSPGYDDDRVVTRGRYE